MVIKLLLVRITFSVHILNMYSSASDTCRCMFGEQNNVNNFGYIVLPIQK